jgi:alkanesulfonate monooxygenase SsuD/methylene tetrahydromethanopterin reductase-like flavin-dependent oxidoreductase (luciferase family)
MPVRFEMLEEQLQILIGLWTKGSFSFDGQYFALRDAVCEPKPVQRPHPPIVVGGYGKPKLIRLAAMYADELNLDNPTPEKCREVFAQLDEACRAVHRDPATVRRSAMLDWSGAAAHDTPAEQRQMLSAYAPAGVEKIVLDAWPGPADPRTIEVLGREVVAALG